MCAEGWWSNTCHEGKFPSPPSILLGGNFPSGLLTLSVTSQVPSLDKSMVRPNGKAVFNSTTHTSSGFCLEEERGDECCVGLEVSAMPHLVPIRKAAINCRVQSFLEELWSGYLYHLTEFWFGVFHFFFLSWTQGGTWNIWALPRIMGLWWVMSLLWTGFSLLHSGTF